MSTPGFTPVNPSAEPGFTPINQQSPETQMPGAIGAISRFGQQAKPYAQTLGRELGSAYDAAKGVFTAPYHAFADPSTSEEQKLYPHASGPAWDPRTGISTYARAAGRMVGEPTADAAMWYGKEAATRDTNFPDKVLSVLPEAIGTGAGTEVGGKMVPSVGERGGKIADTVSARRTLSSAIDEADGFTRKAKTLNVIDKTAQQVFNKTQEQFSLLKGKLIADAQKSIQPLIDADKQAGAKPIISTKAAVDAAQAMAKTDYTPTKLEQGLLDKLSESPEDNIARQLGYDSAEEAKGAVGSVVFDDFLKKGAGGVSTKGLDLESTLKLRTAIGRAMTRAKDPGGRMVLTTAYQGMTDTLNDRFNEIQGKEAGSVNKAFAQYNQNHQAAFQIDDPSSFTSKFMDTPLDHHQARELLGGNDKGFIGANLTQITKQMADKGMNPNDLLRLQEDARRVVSAHDSIMGRYNKSLFRMLSSGDAAQAAMPLGVYALTKGAGLYGFVPYFAATLSGRIPAEMSAMTRFAETMKRLGVSDKAINTRVQPGPFEEQLPK